MLANPYLLGLQDIVALDVANVPELALTNYKPSCK